MDIFGIYTRTLTHTHKKGQRKHTVATTVTKTPRTES